MQIKIIREGALPTRGSADAAGFDVRAMDITKTRIYSNIDPTHDYMLWDIKLGFKTAILPGWAALLLPRSGLGSKGFTFLNTIGLIDPDFRGEWSIKAKSPLDLNIEQGDRVAQFILVPVSTYMHEVTELPESKRGEGGYGSTGVK